MFSDGQGPEVFSRALCISRDVQMHVGICVCLSKSAESLCERAALLSVVVDIWS